MVGERDNGRADAKDHRRVDLTMRVRSRVRALRVVCVADGGCVCVGCVGGGIRDGAKEVM